MKVLSQSVAVKSAFQNQVNNKKIANRQAVENLDISIPSTPKPKPIIKPKNPQN